MDQAHRHLLVPLLSPPKEKHLLRIGYHIPSLRLKLKGSGAFSLLRRHGFPKISSSSPPRPPRSALPLTGVRRRESPGVGLLRDAVPVLLRVRRERPRQDLPRRRLIHR